MPLYIGDYLGDTQRLTTEQHGAYLLLILDYWRNGPPPDDDAVLQQITKLDRASWKRHRPTIQRMFQVTDGQWLHRRIDKELEAAAANAERRSSKASKAAKARWEHSSKDAPSNAPSMPEAKLVECPTPSPSSVPNGTGAEAPRDPVKELFDLGVRMLVNAGKSDGQSRSIIGKWRNQVGDPELARLLLQAQNKTDPVAYIGGAIRNAASDRDDLVRQADRYANLPPLVAGGRA